MKKLIYILPILALACTFSSLPINPLAAPTAADTSTPAPPTETFTPGPTPTFTYTPTLIGALPVGSPTATPLPTGIILYVTPPTFTPVPTDTPESAPTATSVLDNTGFASINLSTNHFYWGGCGQNFVTITATAADPMQVFSAFVFMKQKEKDSTIETKFDHGTAMNKGDNGVFTLAINGNQKSLEKFNSSWLIYQVVGTDSHGTGVARSPVFSNTLTLSACP